jgi:hypothetical protein
MGNMTLSRVRSQFDCSPLQQSSQEEEASRDRTVLLKESFAHGPYRHVRTPITVPRIRKNPHVNMPEQLQQQQQQHDDDDDDDVDDDDFDFRVLPSL